MRAFIVVIGYLKPDCEIKGTCQRAISMGLKVSELAVLCLDLHGCP